MHVHAQLCMRSELAATARAVMNSDLEVGRKAVTPREG
jgi:hypothetical protein